MAGLRPREAAWFLACAWIMAGTSQARIGFGVGDQEYGYAAVRPSAHLFYWLYYAAGAPGGIGPATKSPVPLVLWLEGGPGASSTSYGNFGKLGPLDPEGQPRNTTWVNSVNLLFIDSPVGTGYSYVDDPSALARTNRQTSLDLVELMRQFLDKYPQFKTAPLYIFGESYGGKVAAEFALCLYKEMQAGMSVNLQGVIMGDSWLSGVDHVESWAPYLFQQGLLDTRDRDQLAKAAGRVRAAVESELWQYATTQWSSAWGIMTSLTQGVNIYDSQKPIKSNGKKGGKPSVPCASSDMMNGDVRRALGVPASVTHQNDNNAVFIAQYSEYMKPITGVMERLLDETNLEVTVYAGQNDVFTNMQGTMTWVDRLRWPASEEFRDASRTPLVIDGEIAGSLKRAGKFTALWVHRAGHMVAIDYPAAAAAILRLTTSAKELLTENEL